MKLHKGDLLWHERLKAVIRVCRVINQHLVWYTISSVPTVWATHPENVQHWEKITPADLVALRLAGKISQETLRKLYDKA